MAPDPLPPDLRDLESLLARRPRPEPGAGLRARLLAAARAEQDRPARGRGARAWSHAWRAAAALVLALNLAMSAANGFRYQSLPVRAPDPADFAADRPPVGSALGTRTGERPWPLAASAVARLTPAPDAGGVARRFFEQEGD